MKLIIVLILFFVSHLAILAQPDTLYTEQNIHAFAKFLMTNKHFDLAAQEYERLHFLYPHHRSYANGLFTAYRMDKKFDLISTRVRITPNTDPYIVMDYVLAALKDDLLAHARLTYDESSLKDAHGLEHVSPKVDFGMSMMEGHLNVPPIMNDSILLGINEEYRDRSIKSPVAAGLLSMVVPGAGRVYAKDYKNGIISLLFIAGTAWQSYSRFRKHGSSSVGGWIYGGLGLGFYIGNIYGSVNSAKLYNRRNKKILDEKTKNYITNLMF
ncbi:MAG: hypothetical protein WAU01_13850 [Saprospiraceae bacterium]